MIELTYILRPLVGAVIGYITNDIAIRMLFRPRTAKYIFGFRIPFTPGLIPKEKARIAASIGDAISQNLINPATLERTLLSGEMTGKISDAITAWVTSQQRNRESVGEFLLGYLSPEEISSIRANVTADLAAQVHATLSSAQLGSRIASMAVGHVLEKMRSSLLGKLGADQFVGLLAAPAESLLARHINEMLAAHSEEMAGTMLDDQIGHFLDMRMCDLFSGRDEQISQARATILSLYRTLITERLPRVLETINISGMIEERINEMDVRETERLILEVMRRELRAIVWLGALLGFVMGCVNLLF